MALQLIKLNITASSTTNVQPTVERFFHITIADTPAGGTLTIDADQFFDDTGAQVTALPDLTTDNSYFQVFINGVLQMNDLFTYASGATGSLTIDVPAGGGGISTGTPIILEVANFSPATNTTIET